jgi:hypothetical protein
VWREQAVFKGRRCARTIGVLGGEQSCEESSGAVDWGGREAYENRRRVKTVGVRRVFR